MDPTGFVLSPAVLLLSSPFLTLLHSCDDRYESRSDSSTRRYYSFPFSFSLTNLSLILVCSVMNSFRRSWPTNRYDSNPIPMHSSPFTNAKPNSRDSRRRLNSRLLSQSPSIFPHSSPSQKKHTLTNPFNTLSPIHSPNYRKMK